MNDMLKKRPLTVNHTYDCLFKNRTRGLAEMDYDGSVVPIGKLMKYSTRKIINFLKLSFVFTIPTTLLLQLLRIQYLLGLGLCTTPSETKKGLSDCRLICVTILLECRTRCWRKPQFVTGSDLAH